LVTDIESYFGGLGGFPVNTKITGVYIQYQLRDEGLFDSIVKKIIDTALPLKLLPIGGFMIIEKE